MRLLCPRNSLGKSIGVECHSLLQRTFPTQWSNPGLLHCRHILYRLSYREVLIMTLSTIIIPYRVFFTALFLCSLVIYLSPPRNPPSPQSLIFLLSLQSFAFSRMTCTWKHTVCSLSDWLLSLRNTHLRFPMCCQKEMTIDFRTIAWKIPWTEEPGRLQSMGSQRVGHNWATSQHFMCC